MMRLVILVEGDLEHAVIKSFLAPFCRPYFSRVDVYPANGNGYFVRRFVKDVIEELNEKDTYVLCLIDLYGEPFGIYNTGKRDNHEISVEESFLKLKQCIEDQINHQHKWRFTAFPVIREIETWLFAIPVVMRKLNSQVHPAPETIHHPAEMLNKIYSGYKKLTTGKVLFRDATAQSVYDDNCPHFKLLVDWLKNPPQSPLSTHQLESKTIMENYAVIAELSLRFEMLYDEALRTGDESTLDRACDAEAEYKRLLASNLLD